MTAKDDKTNTISVEYKHKGEEHKKDIKLDNKMKLISEGGKDVPVGEFLEGLNVGEEVILLINDEGHVIGVIDIPDKKKD